MKLLIDILYYAYLLVLAAAVMAGASRYRLMTGATRYFFVLVVIGLTGELAGLWSELSKGSNLDVYNVAGMLQSAILIVYFSELLRARSEGLLLLMITALLGAAAYYLPVKLDQNYFLIWCIAVSLGLSVSALVRMHRSTQTMIRKNAHFWLIGSLLLYWSISAVSLYAYNLLNSDRLIAAVGHAGRDLLQLRMVVIHIISNLLAYAVVCGVFFRLNHLRQ